MTDEEKKELEKLEKADLVDMVGALRDKQAKEEKAFATERKKIMTAFLGDSGRKEEPPEEEHNPLKGKAFERLKKIFS